jgi:hypothetical protein
MGLIALDIKGGKNFPRSMDDEFKMYEHFK